MKKRDYSNPHTWQQAEGEKPVTRAQHKNRRGYVVIASVIILAVGFFTLHDKTQSKQITVAKKSGPDIQTVALPITQSKHT